MPVDNIDPMTCTGKKMFKLDMLPESTGLKLKNDKEIWCQDFVMKIALSCLLPTKSRRYLKLTQPWAWVGR